MGERDRQNSSGEIGTEEVTLAEYFDDAFFNKTKDLHTSIPAQVINYYKARQTVDVSLMTYRHLPDGTGGYVAEPLPPLLDVRVEFLRSGSWFLAPPIAKGDFGRIAVCERSIANWRATGHAGDPGSIGLHTLDGAVFVPGIAPDGSVLELPDDVLMRIGHDSGAPLLEFDSVAKSILAKPFLAVQNFLAKQSGNPAAPPTSSDAHLIIKPESTNAVGRFELNFSTSGSISVDVTYAGGGYPNGSFVDCHPEDDTAASLETDLNDGSGTQLAMKIYAVGAAGKFTIKNTTSDKTPKGVFVYKAHGY